MLIAFVDEMFILSLRHRYVGYGTTTTRTILDHLYATYAKISSADLQGNDAKLCTLYNTNLTIKALVNQVEDAVEYAVAGNTPYTPLQVVGIDFQLILQTGLFNED